MSLKTDIEMVKDELNSEEKFFEKAVITERFIKKYKKLMIGSVVVIVIAVAVNIISNINNQNRIDSANAALAQLQKDPSNAAALNDLKGLSPNLYDLWVYSSAVANNDVKTLKSLENSKTPLLADLSSYEVAQDSKSLDEYSLKQGAVYKDLAVVQSAVLLMNNGKTEEAHQELTKISQDSSLGKIAKALMHYGVK